MYAEYHDLLSCYMYSLFILLEQRETVQLLHLFPTFYERKATKSVPILGTDIECIIQERAQLLDSPVFSTYHPCISSNLKQYQMDYEIAVKICDLHMETKNDMVVSSLSEHNIG
jgi:hypothetical protein